MLFKPSFSVPKMKSTAGPDCKGLFPTDPGERLEKLYEKRMPEWLYTVGGGAVYKF
jgi:hypothetical protein